MFAVLADSNMHEQTEGVRLLVHKKTRCLHRHQLGRRALYSVLMWLYGALVLPDEREPGQMVLEHPAVRQEMLMTQSQDRH